MTSVSASSRAAYPRASLSYRHPRLRAFAAGAAVTIGCAAVVAASVGAGWYTAVAFNTDTPDVRSDVAAAPEAEPPVQIAVLAAEEVKLSPIFLRFPSPEGELSAATPAVNAARMFALAPPAAMTVATDITGAISLPKPPPPRIVSVALYADPKTADVKPARKTPPQQQLASLGPPDIKIAPQEESPAAKTAIYDITAQTVYMPNGEKLEAHSGLGMFMDKPGHVHLKMRGATPPNTYRLTEREALFHGVRALRMTPLDQSTMFNRNGILAHSYMLGPSGQSNGCISFKDYPKFLRAYLRGEIDRITVVVRMDKPPAFYAKNGKGNAL